MKKLKVNPSAIVATAILYGCLFGTPVQGQDFQQVGPKPVPDAGPAPRLVAPAPKEPKAVQPSRLLIPRLNGLRLIDSVAKLQRTHVTGSGLMVENLPMLDDPTIRERLESFIGKPLTQGDLQALAQTIIDWYRAKKYPFVDVAAPSPQDVTNGVVQLVVTESRAGKVTARGNKWFSDGLLTEQVPLKPGDRINIEQLEADKDWLNQNPFRTVNIVAERSDEPGVTDLVIDTIKEKFPGRVYAGYDNSGTPVLGHDRWSMGLNWGNALWMDDQFSYQFTSSDDFWHTRGSAIDGTERPPTFYAHATSYVAMLPWQDKLTIFGSYAQASPRLGPDIGLTGINGQASMRYMRALPSTQHFDEDIQVGYDFKTSNNNLEFGGAQVSDVSTEIDQLLLAYDAKLRDDYGQTSVENSFVYSPGNVTAGNKDPLFLAQSGTPYAKANYVYDHIVVTRILGFPHEAWVEDLGWFKDMSWVTRIVGQKSNRNLLPSEELGIGGADSVRGYDERSANGSDGMLISEEFRSPPFSLAKQLLDADTGGELTQLAAFWDYGAVSDHQTPVGARSSVELESVGLGLHVIGGPSANVKLDLNYGWQLRTLPGNDGHRQFGHIALTLAY